MALSVAVDDTYKGRFVSQARRDQRLHQDGEGLADEVGGQLQRRGQVLFTQGRHWLWLS